MNQFFYISSNFIYLSLIYHVTLCNHKQTITYSKKMHYIKMLSCLRHYAIIGSYDKQNHINACGACKHIFYKSLMPRHIYNPCLCAVRQINIRKPQVNGYTALLLLFKAIGFHAGKRLNEAGLAVVYVSCCSDDEMGFGHRFINYT